jgi:protein SCO1/2
MKVNKHEGRSSIIVKVVVVAGLIISVVSLYLLLSIKIPQKSLAGEGETQNMAQIGGDFKLTDHKGKEFSSEHLKGNFSLIYFGFTYCPDICPTSLEKISEVIATLDKYKIPVSPVFITIDPKRDTPELLKEYLQHFHPKYIALTGSEEQIKDVTEKFKVFYAKVAGDDTNYMMDHSSFIYLMDGDGKYVKHFYLNTPPQEIVNFIRVQSQQTK